MIRRLSLRNWRNYEDVTIEFRPGTTFVVASNGVGKTSLAEAARWALFGTKTRDNHLAVRAGATSAVASVELELPDFQVLTVERTLSGKPQSAPKPPIVRLGEDIKRPEELEDLLISAFNAEQSFLAGLTMPAIDRGRDRPSALGLEDHLGRYYGIDSLRNAANHLKKLVKNTEVQIKQIKDANSISSQRLDRLQVDVERTAQHAAEAAERHRETQARVVAARELEQFKASLKQWHENNSARSAAVETLTARAAADFEQAVNADNLETAFDERLADLDRQIESVKVGIAVNAAMETSLTANDQRLDEAHGDCPVCRRPLDDATVTSAHQANMQDLSVARETQISLKQTESSLHVRRERLRAAQAEWRRIPQVGPPPRSPAVIGDEPSSITELSAAAESAFNAVVETRAAHLHATQQLDDARNADKAMRELESLFRYQAKLRVAVETTEATLTELLDDTIRPLAVEVNQRWQALFPGRGDLTTSSNGNITREVNGHPLPYNCFSTGESMGATILVRLLIAQMVTAVDFCWFDEPLEHLDPDARRNVASLLSRVTEGDGPLKQVVVTTYEEPLARHLQARDAQLVTLLDVRQAS
jgi:DNA repair exonuclease SbcCD ATPase subunit